MKTDDRCAPVHTQIPSSLYRHPAWIAWKETQGWYRAGTLDGSPILCRNLDPLTSMAYMIRTPASDEMDDDFGGRLEELSLRALPGLPGNCAFLRWDLMSAPAPDSRGEWLNTWLLELRMNASTKWRSFRKAATETIALDTMVVDLRGGWAQVFSRMQHRVRYSEHLARRRGTSVARTGETGLGDFYALFRKTAALHGLTLAPESCYRDLFESARENGLSLDLYLASVSERTTAAAIIARHDREAWYLFAASEPAWRHAAGPTAILNRAMRDCIDDGVESIDLFGVAPDGLSRHPLSGLTLFKSGFGGTRRNRAGAWDFVLNQDAYADYVQAEAIAGR